MLFQSLADATFSSLLNVWSGLIVFIPSLIGALIVLIVGLIVASAFKTIIEKIIDAAKIDSLLNKLGLKVYFDRAGIQINSGKFIGGVVYWFLIIAFVLAVTDILQLYGLSQFLLNVVSYIPNIIIATLIILATVVAANVLRKLITASVMSAKLHASKFLGTVAWWATVIFGVVAALIQLGIAISLLNTIITGLVAMIALGGGIAIGLGGKDYAAYLINKLRENTE